MNTTVNNMNKVHVSWDEVPEEYEWFAIDSNRESGYVYKTEPKLHNSIPMWVEDKFAYGFAIAFHGTYTNWKETLQQRPKKTIAELPTQEEKSFEMSLQRVGDLVDLQITGKLSKEQIIKIMEVVYES